MHPDLSPHLHSEECNTLIKELNDCHENNKFKKFLGVCSDIHHQVFRCVMREQEENRRNNAANPWHKRRQKSTDD